MMTFYNKGIKALLLMTALLFANQSVTAADDISVVSTPNIGTTAHYTAFRAPLVQAPLLKLPVGSVRPQGWLREMLVRQANGLCGQLGTVSAWLDKTGNQWMSDTGTHGWEEVPYWLRGYCSLAYLLDNKLMIGEARRWFSAVLRNVKEDGFIGPRNTSGGKPEIWAQMIMLWALQTYYEYSGNESVLTAMTNFFKWEMSLDDNQFLEDYWEHQRGGDNLWSLLWLYNHTGDDTLLPLADKLHRNTADWTQADKLPNYHGVNVAQGFREPATYYMYTHNADHLAATENNYQLMRKQYGQMPGGMYAADENAREGYFDPRQGAETCALVEQMASDELLLSFTGDPLWADRLEDVAFNTLPAAFTPDMRALRYLTSPNMAISDEKLHGPSIDNNLRGMLSMSPFSSRCCQHNHGMGWPYLTEHLTMATTDGGLACVVYLENETKALVGSTPQEVTLTTTTHYPFDETVEITVATGGNDVTFPLYLRIPSWAKGATLSLPGTESFTPDATNCYVRIERQWSDGDTVRLTLPMTVTTRQWMQNKGSLSVDYGPLTLSLLIGEEAEEHDSRDHAFVQDDSHWQEGVDASLWPCYVYKATTPWNYGLHVDADNMPIAFKVERREWPADNFPFTAEGTPLTFTAEGRQIPSWQFDSTGLTDLLPTRWAPRAEEFTPITLIPMGAARLRISAFPREADEAGK